MASNIGLWNLTENIEVRTEIKESIVKISNIKNHLYLQTISHCLYHGEVKTEKGSSILELEFCEDFKVIAMDACNESLYIVDIDGNAYKCTKDLEKTSEICLLEDYKCSRGHTATKCKMKVQKIAIGEYGQLFVTDQGHLWASGFMPHVGIDTETPKRVNFFVGRTIYDVNTGSDFAIAIVSKAIKSDDTDSGEEEDMFIANCPQCLSASQLTSPASQNSISAVCPLGVKVQGSYDIETTSTSSQNDSASSNETPHENGEKNRQLEEHHKVEKNIIFRNTEAAKEFLTRQISRMSSVGEEYLVECTEKPSRIIKENMTNVASFVYEGVKTVGDKVVTLSRHVSGSSDCNSIVENNVETSISRSTSKDDFLSLSQCTTERDMPEKDVRERANVLVKTGSNLINCEVWTWGNIIHGQLGIGDIIKRERPMIITKLSNVGVQKVSVQNYHACVLTLDGRAYIWGRNDHNQVTPDTNMDQSSPKLYLCNKDERVKDLVSGEYYTAVLTSNLDLVYFGKGSENCLQLHSCSQSNQNRVILFHDVLCSSQYVLLNANSLVDNFFTNYVTEEQKFLEEMLTVQLLIVKPLQKKNANGLFEDLCKSYTELLYFWAVNVQSLLEYSNGMISLCDIVIFKYFKEFLCVYKGYIDVIFNVISTDGCRNIAKLIEISPNLCKLRPEAVTTKENDEQVLGIFLTAPLDKLDLYTSVIENYKSSFQKDWAGFMENVGNKKRQAEITKEFWLNSGKSVEFLKSSDRRLIRDSQKHPLFLQNAGRFSSHWFVLFSDLFLHVNGSTPHMHNLTTIWTELAQDESAQIYLKMPEDNLTLYTGEAETKVEWFRVLQNAIKDALNKPDALQPPSMRRGSYTFAKSGFFKDACYTGRWSNAKMHGSGKLEWPDGKSYTGEFSNNQISGFGLMETPSVGVYEGQWKDNQQNGFGIYNYTNNDVYKGQFKDGQPHGHGFLRKGSFMADDASFYVGDWANGQKNGYGVMDDILSGEKYIGCWTDNKRNGIGLIVTSDGIYYEGTFSQNLLTGPGVMILEDGTIYEGEFRGTGNLNGKGTLSLPTGYTIEGHLSGSWNEGIKISNGTFTRNSERTFPKSFKEFCPPVTQKWKALFKQCHQILGISESNNPTKSGTQKIWQNVAVCLSNASTGTVKKGKNEKKFQNSLNNLDIIPPYGREKLDLPSYLEVKNYLYKAFESNFHPLGSLLTDVTEAYTTAYGGRAHPLLLSHAIPELQYICKRLYEIVRFLFPALPTYDKEYLVGNGEGEEVLNYQSLLYPLILSKVHHPLFTLFTLKNEQQERQYKRTLTEWNKRSDESLMAFLSVDQ